MIDIAEKELIGRLLFWEEQETFFKIKAIEPPMELSEDMGDMLRLVSLEDKTESVIHWVSDIGEHFALVPEIFNEKEAVRYCMAAVTSRKCRDIMLEIHGELINKGI